MKKIIPIPLLESIKINESGIKDDLDKMIREYGGFDDFKIETSENIINVSHSKIGKEYMGAVEEDLITDIIKNLNRFVGKSGEKWVFVEQSPEHFMLVKR